MSVDAGSIYSEIRIQLDKLNGDIQKVQASFDKLGGELGKSSDKTKKKVDDNLKKINIAHIAMFASITLMIKKSVQDYAEFEQSLANVQSVARASTDDMELLEQAALKAGQTTKFSGKQAADAMYYLASAGFTARQSMEALDGVLALASATGADLAFTSETVASAISQFGLKASDALKVANVFAAGIANSQATIDKLAASMRYIGPVAAAFDYSIESVTGTLSILYNAGFEASQAGTSLRNVLSDLSNTASPVVKKLELLGIAFEDLNPATNSFADIIRNLNPIAADAGKVMEIFGKEAGPAMIKLLSEGGDAIDEYTLKVTGTNQAIDAAATQNDTLQFALTRLGRSFGEIGKSITSEFAPTVKVAANVVADLLFKFDKLPSSIKIIAGALLIGAGAFAAVSSAAGLLGLSIAAIAGPVAIVIGSISVLTAGSILLYRAYNQTADNSVKLQRSQKELETNTNSLKESVDNYKRANEQLNDKTITLNETERQTLRIRKELSGLEILANLGKTIKSLNDLTGAQKKQNESIDNFKNKVKDSEANLLSVTQQQKKLIEAQKAGIKTIDIYADHQNGDWGSYWVTVSTYLEHYNSEFEKTNKALQKDKTNLYQSQLALENSNKTRQETIDMLASALILGQIELKQIEDYSKAIANEVKARAEQLKVVEQQNTAQAKSNKNKKESIPLTAEEIEANKQLQKTIQKTKEQLEELNATDLEKIEIDRKRAKAEVDLLQVTDKLRKEAKESIDAYYDALKKKTEAEIEDKAALEKIDAQIERHNEKMKLSEERTAKLRAALIAHVEEKKKQLDIDDQARKKADEYIDKLRQLTDVNYDLIGAEKQRAIEEIKASGASEEAMQTAVDAVNEYYDALKNETAFNTFKENMKGLTENTLSGISSIADAIIGLINVQMENELDAINTIAQAQKDAIDAEIEAEYGKNDELLNAQLELLDAQLNAQLESLDAQLQAALEAAGVAEETREERLQREIDEALAAGNTELANEKQKELLRLQITKDFEAQQKALTEKAIEDKRILEEKAIADKQAAEDKKIAIEEKAAKEAAQIAYKFAHATWVLENLSIISKGALAIMQAITSAPPPFNIPLIIAAGIQTGIAIAQQVISEPQPPAMIQGGIVLGSQLRGTPVMTAENGSNELLLNDSSQGQNMMRSFARSIVDEMGGGAGINVTVIFQQDSKETARAVAKVMNDGTVTLKSRAIQE